MTAMRTLILHSAAQAPAVFTDVIDQMDEYARRQPEELAMGLTPRF